jgi:hypothetical protein
VGRGSVKQKLQQTLKNVSLATPTQAIVTRVVWSSCRLVRYTAPMSADRALCLGLNRSLAVDR